MINRLGFFCGTRRFARLVFWLTLTFQAPCYAGSPMFEAAQEAYLAGDIESALMLWRPLAKHGETEAQFALGSIYYGGIGVPVDLIESSYWFLRAAEQGFAAAQYNLGNAYKRGEGVRQNEKRAVLWWRKAAGQGFAAAQFNLATAYLDGAGVAKDIKKARLLYQQSADNGHYPAIQALKQLTDEAVTTSAIPGDGVPATPASASCADWLGKQNPRHYTLQLMSSTRRVDAQDILARHALDSPVICGYMKKEQQRYILLYGVFPDIATAQQAISTLPTELRQNKPWIRRIRAISTQMAGTAGGTTR